MAVTRTSAGMGIAPIVLSDHYIIFPFSSWRRSLSFRFSVANPRNVRDKKKKISAPRFWTRSDGAEIFLFLARTFHLRPKIENGQWPPRGNGKNAPASFDPSGAALRGASSEFVSG